MGISLSKWTFTKLQHLSLPMRRTTTLYWSRTVWSPASTWWSWPKTAKPQEMEVSTPGLIIPLYRMGEYNTCLGFRFQVFPHFPPGKLSERNTRVLVKLPRAGEARHVAPALRLVIFTRSRIFRSLLSSLRKYLWSFSVSSSCWSLSTISVVFPSIWSSMIGGCIFLNSDWKSSLLNPLQGSEVWYHHSQLL